MEKIYFVKKIFFLFFVSFIVQLKLFSQNNITKPVVLNKPVFTHLSENPEESIIDLSNITCWVGNNGFHSHVPSKGQWEWNGTYPNGENVGVVFSEGINWGGLVYDGNDTIVRVNGNYYGSGCKAIIRIFRVRPDYKTADLTRDAANFFNKPSGDVTNQDIRKLRYQYERDTENWPVHEGAIFNDINNDGIYNPNVDIPGVPGAAQTIFIKYDDSDSKNNFQTPPIGLEISETYWTYSNVGAFNNAVFKKVTIVYRGTPTSSANSKIDSMYICQWSDTDLGTPTEDYSGCDTLLNLGYTYNGQENDKVFSALGMAPPAVGYTFLHGVAKYTGNPNDSAIVNLKWKKGYKYVNDKPMTTFIYNGAGSVYSDPSLTYFGALEFYNFMRGKMSMPRYPKGEDFPPIYGVTTEHSTYLLPGDPVTGTGIIDGEADGASDRSLYSMTGPFTMYLGDTAEVVIAMVVGQGYSQLNSVTKLKENVRAIKTLFNKTVLEIPKINFPLVDVIPLHKRIILNWAKNSYLVSTIENFKKGNYNFEGYEVYQFPNKNSALEDGIRIAQYDLKNNVTSVYDTVHDDSWVGIPRRLVKGKDNGIKRFLSITQDALNEKDLIDGHSYYFGVIAYAYNGGDVFSSHIIRSPLKIIEAIPQTENPGIRYTSSFGDTLLALHTQGKGEGKVLPIVIDPSKTDGKEYQVVFDSLNGKVVWHLKEKIGGKVILTNQTNQSGDDVYPIINGIMPKVISAPIGIKEWNFEGGRWISRYNWGGKQFGGGMDVGKAFWKDAAPIIYYVPIELRFTGGSGKEIPSEANGWSQGAVYRKDKNYKYAGVGWMPFTAWDVSDLLNPRQVNVSFAEDSLEGNSNFKWDLGGENGYQHRKGGNEYLIISNTDYNPNYYNNNNNALINNNMYFIWPRLRGEYLASPFKMKIVPNEINLPGDVYEFTAPEVTEDINIAKKDIGKINAFPNPYYTTAENRYVTFNHLPDKAMIRIFDLSGVLIRTIKHDGINNQFEKWNLVNDNNIAVASGIYIVHINMPELNKHKILKLAVVSRY